MKKEYVGSVKIIPLGGLDKIGMTYCHTIR